MSLIKKIPVASESNKYCLGMAQNYVHIIKPRDPKLCNNQCQCDLLSVDETNMTFLSLASHTEVTSVHASCYLKKDLVFDILKSLHTSDSFHVNWPIKIQEF